LSGNSTSTAWNALPMSIATNEVPPESWSLVILSPSPTIKVENHGCWSHDISRILQVLRLGIHQPGAVRLLSLRADHVHPQSAVPQERQRPRRAEAWGHCTGARGLRPLRVARRVRAVGPRVSPAATPHEFLSARATARGEVPPRRSPAPPLRSGPHTVFTLAGRPHSVTLS